MISLVAQTKNKDLQKPCGGHKVLQDTLNRSIQLLPRPSCSPRSGSCTAEPGPQARPCLALLLLPSHDSGASTYGATL